MHTLKLPFRLLTLTGVWMPVDWTLKHPKFVWILFSILCVGLIFIQFGSQVIYLAHAKTVAEFNERLFFIPTGFSCLQKIFVFTLNRERLIGLGQMLLNHHCIPRTTDELEIQGQYDEIIRLLTLLCTVLVNVTMMNLVALPWITFSENRTLPMKVWLPYKVDSDLSYWLSYLHQSVGITLVGISIVGSTLMINGFMFQVCCQLKILGHRFQMLPKVVEKFQTMKKPYRLIYQYEKRAISQNVQHHLYIFKLANTVNELFKSIILQQHVSSIIVVSVNIYQLVTRPEKNMEFMMVVFYMICVLTEYLVYSWFGNELMLESINFQDSIYSIDWTALSAKSGRDLVFIILRASRPIYMDCGPYIVLSLESYIGILKVSYSVFNILSMSTG